MNEGGWQPPEPTPPTPSGDPYAFPPAGLSGFLTTAAFLLMLFVLAPLAASGNGVLGLSAGLVVGFGLIGRASCRERV